MLTVCLALALASAIALPAWAQTTEPYTAAPASMNSFTASDIRIDGLQRMEDAIGQSMTRSDEQLAYYVAQAREVIDLSISSQQGIVEDLRRLHGKPAALAGEPS